MLRISAALILIRQNPIRVLLLKRNDNLSFGGSFAFPGGSLEPPDNQDKSNAAVRECLEETGIKVNKHSLKPFIRIITPQIMKKRYDTQFYVANVDNQQNLDDLQIDLNENSSYQWNTPSNFLTKFIKKEITLFPPVFLQLLILQQLGNNYWEYISNLPQDVHSFPTIFQFTKQQGCNVILSYGDKEFDVEKLIANEQDMQLKQEFIQKMNYKWESDNRFLFKEHLQLFQSFIGDYRSSPLSLLATVNIKEGVFQNQINHKL